MLSSKPKNFQRTLNAFEARRKPRDEGASGSILERRKGRTLMYAWRGAFTHVKDERESGIVFESGDVLIPRRY